MNAEHPAACPLSSDQERRARAEQTGGEPWLRFPGGNTPYVEYAHMDVLLSLQNPRTASFLEYRFIVISQVKELLFDLLHHEFSAARDMIGADRTASAVRILGRAGGAQRLLLSCWDTLSGMAPVEFAEFRDALGSASGFQSFSYRKLEFLLGNKNPAMVGPHERTAQHTEVLDQLHSKSLYDEVLALLSRQGWPIPAEVLAREPAQPHQPHPAVEEAWLAVYRSPDDHRELYQLAEALVEVAYLFARWRAAHLLTVERILGSKPGTGGTDGVSWLRSIGDHRFFPELWSVRTRV